VALDSDRDVPSGAAEIGGDLPPARAGADNQHAARRELPRHPVLAGVELGQARRCRRVQDRGIGGGTG